eukprot:6214453-Pleurochrysis_carterae.AAC.1
MSSKLVNFLGGEVQVDVRYAKEVENEVERATQHIPKWQIQNFPSSTSLDASDDALQCTGYSRDERSSIEAARNRFNRLSSNILGLYGQT